MDAPQDEVIEDILQEHFEEIQYLWIERQNAVHSPDYTAAEVRRIDQRIDAHLDGLVIGGKHALALLEEALTADAGEVTFASARALLALQDEKAGQLVLQAFQCLKDEALEGVMHAIGHAPLGPVIRSLLEVYEKGPVHTAVAAAQLLAARGYFQHEPDRLAEFLGHQDPAVRRPAWAIVALVDANGTESARRTTAY
jgi:hypothetical protein